MASSEDLVTSAASALVERFFSAIPSGQSPSRLVRVLLRRLSQGRPVSKAELGTVLDLEPGSLDALLLSLPDLECNDDGAVVSALGLSLRPTRHVFVVEGRRLYTWCALDTLFLPSMIARAASVSSPCPATGQSIEFTIDATEIRSLVPSSAVMSILIPSTGCDLRNAFCDHVSFFSSADAAASWKSNHPQGRLATIHEAQAIARGLVQAFSADAGTGSGEPCCETPTLGSS